MADVLVDTDVFIDHLRGHRPFKPDDDRVFYSVISRAELFAGRVKDEAPIRTLLAPFVEIAVDRPIAERAGIVRRTTGVAMANALIAATALDRNLILVTRNSRDFGRVDGLRTKMPR